MKALAAALCLLSSLIGVPAIAASELDPPELDQYLRWGPIRARPGFKLSNVGYDNNILFNNDDRVSDYTATLSPTLEGLVLFGDRAFLKFNEQLNYTTYVQNSDQNYLNHEGSARLTVPFNRFGVFTDVRIEEVNFRPIDQQDTRPERNDNEVGVGIILLPGSRTEIEISRSARDLTYDDPDPNSTIAERLDRDEEATYLGVGYEFRGRTRLLFDGVFRSIDFDDPGQGDNDWRELLTGMEFGEGGDLTGTIRVGWADIDADDPLRPDLAEPVGDLELAYRLTGQTRLRFEGERRPGFAVTEGNAYYLGVLYSLRAVHYLNGFLGLEASYGRGRLEFPESTPGNERHDDIRRYEGGVRLRLSENSMGRRVEYSVTLGRYRRDSTIDSNDQSRTTFGIGAIVGF